MKIKQKHIWLAIAGLVLLLGASLVFPPEKPARAAKDSASIVEVQRQQDMVEDDAVGTEQMVADSPVEKSRRDGDENRAPLAATMTVETKMETGDADHSPSNPSAAVSRSVPTISLSPETRALAAEPVQPEPVQPHLPAVFLATPNVRGWSEDDLARVASLAKAFTDAVADPSQSPSDPQYYYRWIDAERLANERYRSYFGNAAFNALRAPGD